MLSLNILQQPSNPPVPPWIAIPTALPHSSVPLVFLSTLVRSLNCHLTKSHNNGKKMHLKTSFKSACIKWTHRDDVTLTILTLLTVPGQQSSPHQELFKAHTQTHTGCLLLLVIWTNFSVLCCCWILPCVFIRAYLHGSVLIVFL